jgi:chromosomal replication initiation ATPase DnaA
MARYCCIELRRLDLETDEQRAEDRWRILLALSLASYALGLPLARVVGKSRDPKVTLARKAAMYVACVAFDMSARRVARAFERDASTVSHACNSMEDRRSEPRFDRWIDALERAARLAPAPFKGVAA